MEIPLSHFFLILVSNFSEKCIISVILKTNYVGI